MQLRMLECFPTCENVVLLQQTIKSLTALKVSESVRVAGPTVQGEVEAVLSMCNDLAMGIPPKENDIERYAGFYKSILKRKELFFTVDQLAIADGHIGGEPNAKLTGRDAVRAQLEHILAAHDSGDQLKLVDIQPLKTFSWTLSQSETKKVQEWISVAALQEVSTLTKKGSRAGPPHLQAPPTVRWCWQNRRAWLRGQ